MKKPVKDILYITFSILLAVNIVLIPTWGEEADGRRVPVLLYHNIVPDTEGKSLLVNITPENFRAHMSSLKNAGFEGVSLDDYYNYLHGGNDLPARPIIITFDDGYLSNYEYAYPVLKELDMKATIFIVTSTVGASEAALLPHFTWSQAKEMEESGVIDIQSHTHSHTDTALLDESSAVRELRLSKYLIEVNLEKECSYLAYPFGSYNENCLDVASRAGYKMQFRLGNNGFNTKKTPPEKVSRITVAGDLNGEELVALVEQGLQSEVSE